MTRSRTQTIPQFREAAECLKVLAHPQRLELIEQMLRERQTVGELAEACGLAPAIVSGHLRLMQRCGFLASTRDGRSVYYSAADPCLKKIMACIAERFAGETK